MQKTAVIAAIVTATFLIGGFFYLKKNNPAKPSTANQSQTTNNLSPHFESSTPASSALFAKAPANVVLDFNLDLTDQSTITITQGDKDYGVGESTIDENKLTLRRKMDKESPEGKYLISFKACFVDGTCEEAAFPLGIEKPASDNFTNLRGKREVAVNLQDISIEPQNIQVDKGTKVTWVNKDSEIHYVNTDAHPSHTYYPVQNSEALNQNNTYSLIFDTPGVYPYHCSAHAEQMIGQVLVE